MKPKTLSGSLVFQRAKQISSADESIQILSAAKKKTILGIAYVEKKRCICLITADRYLLTIAFKENTDLLLKEFDPSQYDIIRFGFVKYYYCDTFVIKKIVCL